MSRRKLRMTTLCSRLIAEQRLRQRAARAALSASMVLLSGSTVATSCSAWAAQRSRSAFVSLNRSRSMVLSGLAPNSSQSTTCCCYWQYDARISPEYLVSVACQSRGLARALTDPPGQLSQWRNEQLAAGSAEALAARKAEQAETQRLRREVKRLEEEVEIL